MQDRDGRQQITDSNYYDDGPSMMPSAETFAGNQENWGASATDDWTAGGADANANANANTSNWNAPSGVTAGTTAW